ncbi:MAG: hypothetical protein ACUVXH_11990, partial [Anaerolineae bacterium]
AGLGAGAAAGGGGARWAAFPATAGVRMALARAGGDRQEGHEAIRRSSMEAWEALRQGLPNPLPDLLAEDPFVCQFLAPEEVRRLMAEGAHPGLAATRSREFAARLRQALAQP